MSGSEASEAEDGSVLRVAAFGVLAMLGPPVAGMLIALTRPARTFSPDGLELLVGCAVLAGVAALIATVAATQPITLGLMSGAGLALGSLVREGSFAGAVVALAAGAVGGLIADRGAGARRDSRREVHILLVIAAMLSAPLALVVRLGPTQASSALSGQPVLASATPRSDLAPGYVLHGRPGRFLDSAVLVRVQRRGIGSWTADGAISLPENCRFPGGIDGTDRIDVVAPRASAGSGVRVASVDVSRVCSIEGEGVVAGVGPPGTTRIEAETIAGEEVDVPVGVGGAYVVLLEEGTPAANFVRITFRDAGGTLLDGKPLMEPGTYANLAYLSDLIERSSSATVKAENPVTVSKYILSPVEFQRLCGSRPPHGDGFVTIGIVRRDDGVTREVVVGSGMPLSIGHPRPDPPLVRESSGVPCFVS